MSNEKILLNTKQRFALRKLSIGVVSVMVGTTLFFGVQVHASTTVSSTIRDLLVRNI